MDFLSPVFSQLALSARVFFSGSLCGISDDHNAPAGHLHVLRRGVVEVESCGPHSPRLVQAVTGPSVLFYPRPLRHTLRADEAGGAEIVCAFIEFGAGTWNPLLRALPDLLIVPLEAAKELASTVDLLFGEASSDYPGRQTALDRLAEYSLVLLLRAAMREKLVSGGALMGLADPRLAPAMAAMHQRPEDAWSLEELAKAAGMSRARFAVHFHNVVGVTPFDYLADWRIGIAQSLLRRGKPLKIVAPTVGYGSSAALTRAFRQRVGLSPTQWLAREQMGSEDRGAASRRVPKS